MCGRGAPRPGDAIYGSTITAWLAIRVRAGEYAARVNAAADLLEAGVPVAEAARVLAGRFGVLGAAGPPVCRARGPGVGAGRGAAGRRVVFTVKLPAGWPGGCGRMPVRAGLTHLRGGHPGAGRSFSARGHENQSPQVNDRAVEAEFVFGRHAATELSVAYAILVPQRRARAARPGQEGRTARDERGDLCPGLQRPAEEGRDDRVADRGAARARRDQPA